MTDPVRKERNLRVTIDYKLKKELKIFTDRLRVRQVLINLLNNAIKYSDNGGNIVISCSACEKYEYEIAVIDHGIGIRNENMDKIFEPFVQSESYCESRYGGTGLDLAICKKISELLQGELTVDSEYGKGSTFSFKFKTEKISEIYQPSSLQEETCEVHPDLEILIVEDNLINQKVLKKVLQAIGISRVQVVTNPLDSFDLVKRNKFDLILMDLKMPEMDGITTARKIRNILSDQTPIIIAVTANSFEEEKNLCLSEGFSDYLTKPVKIDTIRSTLARYFPKKPGPSSRSG